MQTAANLVTSKGGIAGIAAGLVWFFTAIAPVLPPAWGNFISGVLGLVALYYHGTAIGAIRGIKK